MFLLASSPKSPLSILSDTHSRSNHGFEICEARIACTHPHLNPAPSALLVSRATVTDASFSVSRSTAAVRPSKSPLDMGKTPGLRTGGVVGVIGDLFTVAPPYANHTDAFPNDFRSKRTGKLRRIIF